MVVPIVPARVTQGNQPYRSCRALYVLLCPLTAPKSYFVRFTGGTLHNVGYAGALKDVEYFSVSAAGEKPPVSSDLLTTEFSTIRGRLNARCL